jgi:hypothetical protein
MNEEDNIFDEDDALNCILYEDAEKESDQSEKKGGCLGLILVLIIPTCLLGVFATQHKPPFPTSLPRQDRGQ